MQAGRRDRLTRSRWDEIRRNQVEIRHSVDLLVVADAGCAIAEAELRADVDLNVAAAFGRGAFEGATGIPGIARKRPGYFAPEGRVRPFVAAEIAGPRDHSDETRAGEGHARDQNRCAAEMKCSHCRPAAARASPVSSRMGRPLFARSTA